MSAERPADARPDEPRALELAAARQEAPPATVEPMRYMIDPFSGSKGYLCNFDDRTSAGQALASRMVNGADLSSDDVIGEEIAIVAALLQPVELPDKETGELRWSPRVVLLMEDGSTVGFVSVGIAKSLQLLSAFRGPGPWAPPIRVKVRQVKTRAARRTFVLDLIDDSRPTVKTEGK